MKSPNVAALSGKAPQARELTAQCLHAHPVLVPAPAARGITGRDDVKGAHLRGLPDPGEARGFT
ncbi:MAG: hypothetical protein H7290_05655 [Flavobacterium sp.]|nr:hypothetical protein [Aeromicrobium sp.]